LVTRRASAARGLVNLTVSILCEHLAGRFELPRHLRSGQRRLPLLPPMVGRLTTSARGNG
jgi:hypothetical protein